MPYIMIKVLTIRQKLTNDIVSFEQLGSDVCTPLTGTRPAPTLHCVVRRSSVCFFFLFFFVVVFFLIFTEDLPDNIIELLPPNIHMSRNVGNVPSYACVERNLKSVCTSTQADQSLRCPIPKNMLQGVLLGKLRVRSGS